MFLQVNRDSEYEKFVSAVPAAQKLMVYRRTDALIQNIVRSGIAPQGQRTIIEYLRGIAHLYNMDS